MGCVLAITIDHKQHFSFSDLKPLLRRKRETGRENKWPHSFQHRGRYGTSTTDPVCSVSSFIQSALNEVSETKKEMCLSDTLHEEGKSGGPKFIVDSHKSGLIAERVNGGKRYGERLSRARKTIKLGETLS